MNSMKKSFIPDDEEIMNFIKKNPGCNREQLRNTFYKEGIGKKKIFSTDLAKALSKLKKQGLITETEIKRGPGNAIVSSILNVSKIKERKQKKSKRGRPKMKLAKKPMSQNRTKELEFSLNNTDKSIIISLDTEKKLANLQKELNLPKQTIFNSLKKLESYGLISQNRVLKSWKLTSHGEEKVESAMAEKYGSDDTLFLQIPFLIKAGERFGIDDLVERANSFYGFYYKHGLSQDEAEKDFKNKLEKILINPLVVPYIQKIRYKYEVVCSEEKLLLWRLYSMLNTVLYRSEKNKIGFGTVLYDQLIYLLKDKFGSIEAKIKDLPEYEQYMVWLLYNGVQLETLLPKMEIINGYNEDIRDELKKRGIPIKIYHEGKENETTLIEEI